MVVKAIVVYLCIDNKVKKTCGITIAFGLFNDSLPYVLCRNQSVAWVMKLLTFSFVCESLSFGRCTVSVVSLMH